MCSPPKSNLSRYIWPRLPFTTPTPFPLVVSRSVHGPHLPYPIIYWGRLRPGCLTFEKGGLDSAQTPAMKASKQTNKWTHKIPTCCTAHACIAHACFGGPLCRCCVPRRRTPCSSTQNKLPAAFRMRPRVPTSLFLLKTECVAFRKQIEMGSKTFLSDAFSLKKLYAKWNI